MAKQSDREDRQEQVASSQRKFWAQQLLLERFWQFVKRRKDLKRWSRQPLLENFEKVTQMREIIVDTIDTE